MRLIEWTVPEDDYQEQIYVPADQAKAAAEEGIEVENKKQLAVRITNMTTAEVYEGRLKITGNRQIYLPTEVQKLLDGSKNIRIQILGG